MNCIVTYPWLLVSLFLRIKDGKYICWIKGYAHFDRFELPSHPCANMCYFVCVSLPGPLNSYQHKLSSFLTISLLGKWHFIISVCIFIAGQNKCYTLPCSWLSSHCLRVLLLNGRNEWTYKPYAKFWAGCCTEYSCDTMKVESFFICLLVIYPLLFCCFWWIVCLCRLPFYLLALWEY